MPNFNVLITKFLSSNDGGGGERVLWRMVDNLQKMDKDNKLEIAIYSGDLNVTPHEILAKIKVWLLISTKILDLDTNIPIMQCILTLVLFM